MRRENLAWAAGLFEGEGSFAYQRRGKYMSMCAELGMTDEDQVRRFHHIVGIGNVTGPHPGVKSYFKATYRWKTGSFEGVQAIVALLWHWLGPRRRAKAAELLAAYETYTNVRRYSLAQPADVAKVKSLLADGVSKRQVATMIDRSYGFVNHIKSGRTHAQAVEDAP